MGNKTRRLRVGGGAPAPSHRKYRLLKCELEAILIDYAIVTSSPGREPSASRYF